MSGYLPLDLEVLRDRTRALGVAEWLSERTQIPTGYTTDVLMAIEFADMHRQVVSGLHSALRVAMLELEATQPVALASIEELRAALRLGEQALTAQLVRPCLCRCGWTGAGDHMCHACTAPRGTPRRYPDRAEVSGWAQTSACDECWARFQAIRFQVGAT